MARQWQWCVCVALSVAQASKRSGGRSCPFPLGARHSAARTHARAHTPRRREVSREHAGRRERPEEHRLAVVPAHVEREHGVRVAQRADEEPAVVPRAERDARSGTNRIANQKPNKQTNHRCAMPPTRNLHVAARRVPQVERPPNLVAAVHPRRAVAIQPRRAVLPFVDMGSFLRVIERAVHVAAV